MKDSLFGRITGSESDISIHVFIGSMSEYAAGVFTKKELFDLWRPGMTMKRELSKLLGDLDAESTKTDKMALVVEWDGVLLLSDADELPKYNTVSELNDRFGI